MNMIEKVARAIDKAGMEDAKRLGFENAGMCFDEVGSEENRQLCLALAKAAIEAMREPSEGMRKACTFEIAELTYPNMIDAALKE